MGRLSDTSAEAQRVLSSTYRAMSPSRKLRILSDEFRLARELHAAGRRRVDSKTSDREIRGAWRSTMLGVSMADCLKSDVPMNEDLDNLTVLREVLSAFDSLGIAYAIGGSWASSYYGEPRMTRDADISVDPFAGREQDFADRFGADYYVSVDAMREANRSRSTFNVIHTSTAFKVDVFVRKDDPFETSVMARRRTGEVGESDSSPLVWVSPEDVILLKLRWYRLGNEISDRQWSDILGVMRTQRGTLDEDYMSHWAEAIGVADLLERARSESA